MGVSSSAASHLIDKSCADGDICFDFLTHHGFGDTSNSSVKISNNPTKRPTYVRLFSLMWYGRPLTEIWIMRSYKRENLHLVYNLSVTERSGNK